MIFHGFARCQAVKLSCHSTWILRGRFQPDVAGYILDWSICAFGVMEFGVQNRDVQAKAIGQLAVLLVIYLVSPSSR